MDDMSAVVRRSMVHTLKDGQKIVLSALGLNDFAMAREQALDEYQRQKVKTWTANADLMPEEQRPGWIRGAFDRAEQITIQDLPKKTTFVPVVTSEGQVALGKDGQRLGKFTEVEYTIWWMAETPQGKLFMAWLSMRHDASQRHMTLDDADAIFTQSFDELESTAQKVGKLTQPIMVTENPTVPPETVAERIRRKRRKKRKQKIRTGPS